VAAVFGGGCSITHPTNLSPLYTFYFTSTPSTPGKPYYITPLSPTPSYNKQPKRHEKYKLIETIE